MYSICILAHPSAQYVMILDHGVDAWVSEGNYHSKVVKHPHYMEQAGMGVTAKRIFPTNHLDGKTRLVTASPSSKPELGMRVKTDGLRRVPLAVEWKTWPFPGIEEIIQTSLGHIQYSFFNSVSGQSWLFYGEPPCCLSALGLASAVVIMFVAELVGVLHFSVYAGACTVGDEQYQQHIKMLGGHAG